MSRVALGDFGITLVRPGFYWWSGGAMLGVFPRSIWSRKFEPDELNRVRMGRNCHVFKGRVASNGNLGRIQVGRHRFL
jgi:hypothetical protein